jgi:hypothetical protein
LLYGFQLNLTSEVLDVAWVGTGRRYIFAIYPEREAKAPYATLAFLDLFVQIRKQLHPPLLRLRTGSLTREDTKKNPPTEAGGLPYSD